MKKGEGVVVSGSSAMTREHSFWHGTKRAGIVEVIEKFGIELSNWLKQEFTRRVTSENADDKSTSIFQSGRVLQLEETNCLII